MTALDVEIAVSEYFNPRVNLIVPNVSWGMLLYECDLLVVTPSNYLYEVEIKVSANDLRNDLKKNHGHRSERIKRLYFAVPAVLESAVKAYAPERAGILLVGTEAMLRRCWCDRDPKENRSAPPCSAEDRLNVYRLGCMRIWTLKKKIAALRKEG